MIITPTSKVYLLGGELGSGSYGHPTPPADLWPQTPEAILRGCSCPKEENEKRIVAGQPPVFTKGCRVHDKVCQAEDCGHGTHAGVHFRCEHCTNTLHICMVCEKVYLEDGDLPELYGWKYVAVESGVVSGVGAGGAVVSGWRCTACV